MSSPIVAPENRPRQVETRCSKCREPIVLVNPSRYEAEEPYCPLCQIASFEGVCRLLGYPKPIATRKDN